ncbi:dynein axonemal assembly factor 4 isoform X2 [Anabrus simplex]|uniref:dynein axonemal assembly factor 4 isoform X2 n=1 Tax=Anabrus simplex TaxID=316456 RepID=UPI0035A2E183
MQFRVRRPTEIIILDCDDIFSPTFRMPILVKDFSWRQTDTVIIIRVPLKGIHFSKADIFTFDNYIKAHFSPFLFEVFLFSQVKEAESKCTKTDDELVFELLKTEPNTWEKLEADLTKSEKQRLRLDILARFQQKAKQDGEARAGRKQELQQLAVREQMSINSKTHQHIQDLKKAAREEALEEVNQWRTSLNKPPSILVDQPEPELTCEERLGSTSKNIFSPPDESNKGPRPVPFPRKEGRISVKFTPRVFPTPQRQSRSAEEQEWLEKQAEAVRSTGFVAEDLTPEEQNPLWLKEKGDSFFRLGNFLGAISAYTHAITMGSKLPALFSNRGAAHLAHGNLHRTLEDTSKVSALSDQYSLRCCDVKMAVPLSVCTREEERTIIRFLWSEGVPGAEIHKRLSAQYRDNILPQRSGLNSSKRVAQA